MIYSRCIYITFGTFIMEEQLKKMNSKLIKARKLINAINKDMKVIIGDDKINPEVEDLGKDFESFRVDSFNKLTAEGYEGTVSHETIKMADLLLRRLDNVLELELDDEAQIVLADNFSDRSKKVLQCLKDCDKLSREHQEMLIRMLKLSEKLDFNMSLEENMSNVNAIMVIADEFLSLG